MNESTRILLANYLARACPEPPCFAIRVQGNEP